MALRDLTNKAKQAAAQLKAEYEAGKRGDETPPAQLWASPKQQLDGFTAVLRSFRSSPDAAVEDEGGAEQAGGSTEEVTEALRKVDWATVRAATAEKSGEAAKAMRSMAEQVDWQRVQTQAGHVSRSLIAAVAAGQIPIGGSLGPMVVRTITNRNDAGQRVANELRDQQVELPPDYRDAISTTATEV